MWCTMSPCGPSTGPIRSHGLSDRHSIATAHSSTVRRRLTHGPRRLRLDVPDGREDLQHVRTVDLRDRPLADARERVPLEAPQPVVRVVLAAPAAALLLDDALGRFGERGNALDASPVGERVAPGPRQLAVGQGNLTGFGQRRRARRRRVRAHGGGPRMTSRWIQLRVPSGLT